MLRTPSLMLMAATAFIVTLFAISQMDDNVNVIYNIKVNCNIDGTHIEHEFIDIIPNRSYAIASDHRVDIKIRYRDDALETYFYTGATACAIREYTTVRNNITVVSY